MRIRRLEVQGFKSFADKTELELANGITAVVGPNGSGKSNLADAIKWVLGEQSVKALRGSRMDEVIFSGTKSRRGLGLAEVSMVFDNSSRAFPLPFNEVAVTRRVFRSGESDYYLNQSQCRLRDVQDLFLDTGVGKDAYSFIGQGRIEELLSARPEERRAIFEEVAGIAKYKARKRETGNKLADTEAALTRVRDLLHELENQLAPLELEAATARQYLQLEQGRQAAERDLLLYELNALERRQQRDERQRQQLADQQLAAQHAVLQLEADEERARLAETASQESLARLGQELHQHEQQTERLQGDRRSILARMNEREGRLSELASRHQQQLARQQELTGQHQELAQSERQLADTVAARQTELQELGEALSRLSTAEADQRLQQAEQALGDYAEQKRAAQLASSLWSDRQARANDELTALVNNRQAAEQQRRELQDKLVELQRRLQLLTSEGQSWREQQRQVASEQTVEAARLQAAEQQERAAEQQLAAVQSRLRLLQDVVDGLEGYQRGVRALLQAKRNGHRQLQGLVGAVGDLLQVPAELEYAIEIALGASLQFIVSETEADARNGINYLKSVNAGRATFLPLSVVQPRQRRPVELSAAGRPGALGFAADLVSFEPAVQNVMQNLLGNILVVETLEAALSIAQATHHQVRMVTLEGDMLLPGGSLSGGSRQQRGSSLLGRQRELSTLAEQQEQLSAAARQSAQLAQTARERLAGLSRQAGQLDEQLRAWQAETSRLELEHGAQQTLVDSWSQQLTALAQAEQETDRQLEDCRHELGLAMAQAAAAEQACSREELALASIKADSADQLRRRGELQSAAHRLEVELSSLREQRQGLARQSADLEQRMAEIVASQAELQLEQQRVGENLDRDRQQLHSLDSGLEQLAARQAECAGKLQAERDQLAAEQEQARQLRQQIREGREQQESLTTALYSAELRLSRLQSDCESLLGRLEKDHGVIDRSGLHSTLSNRGQGEELLEQIKEQILQLGPVRVGALQELERLQERVAFLQNQQQDLLQARLSLEQIIQEIDQLMSKRFLDAFVEVRRAFQRTFVELFDGGEADLKLSDPARPLETGIEILVQPPGKNLQNINLLSGGEKAMTAVALVCAVLQVKPTPFCVLDEIDAPLDDANTRRLMRVVKRLAEQTQFVIITHSKETMLAADTLYGITMPERGVSQVISVKLAEAGDN